MLSNRTLVIAGAAVGVAVLVWLSTRGAKGVGEDIGSGAVNLVDGVVSGAVTTAGSFLGIPLTDKEKAEQARKAGDVWEASKYMTAPEFMKWIAAGMPRN
ncbi:MAG TPA: hypothetical protein VEC35_23440 [Noviherbaspirillum sp.]|nr:hypothetical protein [Noviherbaspirillum sp.]